MMKEVRVYPHERYYNTFRGVYPHERYYNTFRHLVRN